MNQIRTTFRLLFVLSLMFTLAFGGIAQDKSERPSPPEQATAKVSGVDVTIDYSQPAVKDRKIWGELVPYGKVWRTGANEATWIEVSKDVTIGGKSLPKGKYGLFTIPGEDEWVIIINKTWSQWGAYEYESDKDLFRITAKPEKSDKFYERFTINLDKSGDASFNWANLSVPFSIEK